MTLSDVFALDIDNYRGEGISLRHTGMSSILIHTYSNTLTHTQYNLKSAALQLRGDLNGH